MRQAKRLYSLQTRLSMNRLQYAAYVATCGAVAVALFLGAYRLVFALNDSMWAFSLLLAVVAWGMVWVVCRPFTRMTVVDVYADSLELSPWHFWRGCAKIGRVRRGYETVVSCEFLPERGGTLLLGFDDGRVLLLRLLHLYKVVAFLQQRVPTASCNQSAQFESMNQ